MWHSHSWLCALELRNQASTGVPVLHLGNRQQSWHYRLFEEHL
jgi:hypothetical protein